MKSKVSGSLIETGKHFGMTGKWMLGSDETLKLLDQFSKCREKAYVKYAPKYVVTVKYESSETEVYFISERYVKRNGLVYACQGNIELYIKNIVKDR